MDDVDGIIGETDAAQRDPAVSGTQLTREPVLAPVETGRLAPRPQPEEPVVEARGLGPDELWRKVGPD